MLRRTVSFFSIGALAAVACMGVVDTADAAPKKKPSATSKPAPAPAPTPAPAPASGGFDKEAATSALSSVDLQKCKATNAEKGDGHVFITFAPAGNASDAVVDRGPWLGTPVAKCIAGQFKKAKIPAFSGDPVKVGKTFKFE